MSGRSRIAVFSGYGAPFNGRRPKRRNYGAPLFDNPRSGPLLGYGRAYGAPLFDNPRSSPLLGYGAPLFDNPRSSPLLGYGRRGYSVKASGRAKPYRVPAKRNTPAMKKAMNRFKKAAKSCSRKTRNSRTKGAFQRCMKSALRKKSKR